MIVYKLTTADLQTGHGHILTTWPIGFTPERLSGKGSLCDSGWYHGYPDPLLAVLMNPAHGNFNPVTMRMIVVDTGRCKLYKRADKLGFVKGTVKAEMDVPVVTTEQCIRFGIYAALEVYSAPSFIAWANGWLDGSDRRKSSAEAARAAAAAAWLARVVRAATEAAAMAAWAAMAAEAAAGAAWAARAAWSVARAAARAAEAAAWAVTANPSIDLVAAAHKAVTR